MLEAADIEYVVVSGYVTILTGRSRATEDVDVVLERLSETELADLADRLDVAGYWGMAMPLEQLGDMLLDGERLRIAEEDEIFPNFEVWLASTNVDREALRTAITAEIGEHELSISSIELRIAYKLRLAKDAESIDGKDFEDALHLYLTFRDRFNADRLEQYVERFDVEDYYAELEGV